MNSSLFAPLFSDSEVAGQFSDAQFVRAMLEVESALATVQGRLGVIPTGAAARIVDVADRLEVDFERLRNGVEKSGIPVIELVRQLREQVEGEAADYVHWGATSQDIFELGPCIAGSGWAWELGIKAGKRHSEPFLAC